MTVGIGFDIHRLVPGRPLRLGGTEIPHEYGLLGHSDGDVLLHSIMDALLGAAGMGDLGSRFPPGDPSTKDISSEVMLARVMDDVRPGWRVVNVDAVVVAEEPKIAPYVAAIKDKLAGPLGTDRVSIKGKTAERLGSIGEREAIAAYAVVQLEEKA